MKIVVFKGGIGNQLFQYCLGSSLEQNGYRVYYRDETFGHNGLEIHKYFDVDVRFLPKWFDYVYRIIKEKHPVLFSRLSTLNNIYDESKIIFEGYWQDKMYMPDNLKISFKDIPLSEKNKKVLVKINTTESVSIHVRRGDYLRYPDIYGGICTPEYYAKAIDIIKGELKNPVFYIFSDDIEWCRQNMKLSNAEYIDWNVGNDSIYDMYLMSKCKANIIANSTFSYWGSMISQNDMVIYPSKWLANHPVPNLFKREWLRL